MGWEATKSTKGTKEEGAMDGKVEKAAERVTGKERLLRGGKYFVGVFAATFVTIVLLLGLHEPSAWGWGIVGGLCRGLPAGLISGLAVMAFPRGRLWQGVLAVVVGMVASFGGVLWSWFCGG